MSNKYLEKIAGLADAANAVGKSLGRIAKKTVTGIGNQFHLADGGGYRDFAHDHLGIKDPVALAKFDGSKDGVEALKRAALKNAGAKASFGTRKDAVRQVQQKLPGLKAQQTDGRILAGGATAAGAYGLYKAKKALDEPSVKTYNY